MVDAAFERCDAVNLVQSFSGGTFRNNYRRRVYQFFDIFSHNLLCGSLGVMERMNHGRSGAIFLGIVSEIFGHIRTHSDIFAQFCKNCSTLAEIRFCSNFFRIYPNWSELVRIGTNWSELVRAPAEHSPKTRGNPNR